MFRVPAVALRRSFDVFFAKKLVINFGVPVTAIVFMSVANYCFLESY